ncbi:NUDIX hydrolase [Ferrimonas balearica DSM 9799]|uniref:NUDIX hydrolase n=1 Tax=Ferrimonas balearica (strain DSM 9799 / CCM 4581 / KCTC 23876 / PAT) TaxID=550540 RepID=E1SRJ6_FERBD|nr:CoA pyrophosphatase [Ferrimonas balearica]ADN75947.1 NUDIX hydrolase [Ferrimonas balearica DSM 9799]
MDTTEFMLRFQLQPGSDGEDPLKSVMANHPKLRDAAVLIALQEIDGQLQLLLTERTAHMPTHAGQIAFPGGKMDAGDASPWHTALRESWEEIGLPPEQVLRVGELPVFHTISRFRVFPQVGLITEPFRPVLSEREVARLFHAPLTDFLDARGRWRLPVRRPNGIQGVYFMPHHVWGATAAMIEQLVRHLGYAESPFGP